MGPHPSRAWGYIVLVGQPRPGPAAAVTRVRFLRPRLGACEPELAGVRVLGPSCKPRSRRPQGALIRRMTDL
jgi:hypothetical protein